MAGRPRTQGGVKIQSPRLYLFTPPLGDAAAFAATLAAVLNAGDTAALLLRLQDADERTLINRIKAIGAVVQRRDIALLLDGRPELVARAGADGAHLTGIAALTAAIGALKPDRIAGCGGLRSRHDAMLAGEAAADYVLFGEPVAGDGKAFGRTGREDASRPAFATIVERVAWWAQVFEPPCVGYAASLDEVGPLAAAGADFVALGEWIWNETEGAAAIIKQAMARLAAPSSSPASPAK